jgi:NAD(P)H-flavin reductase
MCPPSTAGDTLIVVCGPPPMCRAVKRALASLGYPDSNVYSYM